MNVEIWSETPIFLFWEYLFRNFGILSLQCAIHNLDNNKIGKQFSSSKIWLVSLLFYNVNLSFVCFHSKLSALSLEDFYKYIFFGGLTVYKIPFIIVLWVTNFYVFKLYQRTELNFEMKCQKLHAAPGTWRIWKSGYIHSFVSRLYQALAATTIQNSVLSLLKTFTNRNWSYSL